MINNPDELVRQQTRVRVHSGAIGHESQIMAEGRVVGYSPNPQILVESDDGRRSWWSITLPITEMTGPESPTRCPRCGSSRPLGEYRVCNPCAEVMGWQSATPPTSQMEKS